MQLAEAVDAAEEVWTIDTMPTSPFLEVEDELVEIRARYPEHIYQPTQELIAPKIRVRRGFAGTTAATHADTTTLTPAYGASAGGGGGAIAVDNTVDAPAEVTTIIVPGADVSTPGEATMAGRFYAQATDPGAVGAGAVWKDTSLGVGGSTIWRERNLADTAWNPWFQMQTVATGTGNATSTASATAQGSGNANARLSALSGDGGANASSYAEATGDGETDTSSIARAQAGGDAYAFINAETLDGFADATTIATAQGEGDADARTSATTLTGEPTAGFKVTRGAVTTSLTANVTGAGLARIIAVGLPTADPGVAGQLWQDNAAARVIKVSAG